MRGLLEPFATVRYLAAEAIDAEAVRNADALIIRTRTRCNSQLLDGSKCKVIATATIGTDHIDLPYCQSRGITVVNAPGCNAPAVAQYVFASILAITKRPLTEMTIGIVGVGNVGRIVEQWAHSLGMTVLRCDPPRQLAEGGQWNTLDEIAEKADIVTFHTPLTKTGANATFHLIGKEFLTALKRKPILINAARGPVADTQALIEAIRGGQVGPVAIDCWENEPAISHELLELVTIATPHIAGYSRQGKVRASQMALDAITKHLGLPHLTVQQDIPAPAAKVVNAVDIESSYNPLTDTAALRESTDKFEALRNHYDLRNEVKEAR